MILAAVVFFGGGEGIACWFCLPASDNCIVPPLARRTEAEWNIFPRRAPGARGLLLHPVAG